MDSDRLVHHPDPTEDGEQPRFRAIPPALESEKAVLGLILEGSDETERICGLLGDGESFVFEKHRIIYQTAQKLSHEGQVPDLPNVVDRLRAEGTLERCGGASYLFDLPNTGLDCNAENYCMNILEARVRSRLQEILYRSQLVNSRGGDLASIQAELQQTASTMSLEGLSKSSYQLKTVAELAENSEGIEWCIKDIVPSDGVVILSGDSGVGKTWMALHACLTVAAGEPCFGRFETTAGPVLFVDEESGDRLLGERLRLLLGGNGQIRLPVHFAVFQVPALDTPQGQTRLVNTIREHGIKLVVIDVLLRVHSLDENDASQMSKLTTALSRIARTENCAILILHHTRKKSLGSNRPGDRLRGSTEIKGGLDGHLYCEKTGDGRIRVIHEKSRFGSEVPSLVVVMEVDEETMHLLAEDEQETKLERAIALILDTVKTSSEPVLCRDLDAACEQEEIGGRTASEARGQLEAGGLIRPTWVPIPGKQRRYKAYTTGRDEHSDTGIGPQDEPSGRGRTPKPAPEASG